MKAGKKIPKIFGQESKILGNPECMHGPYSSRLSILVEIFFQARGEVGLEDRCPLIVTTA